MIGSSLEQGAGISKVLEERKGFMGTVIRAFHIGREALGEFPQWEL
jgi:hypothetical protein